MRWGEARHQQYDAVIAACKGAWVRVVDIGKRAGVSDRTAAKALEQAYEDMRVEYRSVKINGRWVDQYRAAPPGYIPPLYQSNLDARPLAEAFGGYTYYHGGNTWHQ